jgi:hypothetical protein
VDARDPATPRLRRALQRRFGEAIAKTGKPRHDVQFARFSSASPMTGSGGHPLSGGLST